MKIFCLLIFVLLGMLCGCRQQQQQQQQQPQEEEDTSNRTYFTFRPEERRLLIPVQLNDSVTVKLMFDTGCFVGYNHEFVTLDTGVLSANPSLPQKHIKGISIGGSAWSKNGEQAIFYDSMQLKLKMGHTDFVYSGICAFPYKEYYHSAADGMFNIPKSDTTHVWELNFEHNYMEVHPADSCTFPEDCMILPLEDSKYGPFIVTFPLKIRFSDKDSLTLHQKFFIDAGIAMDVILLSEAPEREHLNQREDAAWVQHQDKYVRYYTATATFLDSFTMDSLRVYTLDYKNQVHHPYLIGLNFLKRFNCFFDMKNKRLGLQPLRSFKRLVNPLYYRFHYSAEKGKDGRYIVDCVADYEKNYYKTAGLQVGDEIVAMDGVPYGDITREIAKRLRKLDTLVVDIVRDGNPQRLYVKIDPNEPTGD